MGPSTDNQNIIDSHVHLDLIERHHPWRIQWLRENGCSVVSWSYFSGIDSVSRLKKALQVKAGCIRRLSAAGLGCRYLAGVHPRSIPPDLKPEQVGALLEPFLADPLCPGIGEVGLETGDQREQEFFIAQLELGQGLSARGRIIGVHTPRSNKPAITDITLKILSGFAKIASSLVVDHCSIATIGAVLNAGFHAGVTLSPLKTSPDELRQIALTFSDRIDRIMCNTDSGSAFFEDLVRFSRSSGLPPHVRKMLAGSNAARFYALPLPI